jgi:pimeloyl-ACP methyl ester carboxylesterase
MFFYPNQDDEAYQKNKQNGMLEEVTIEEDGASLGGWFGKNATGKAPLVIYFGGNGECSARRFDNLETYQIWDTFEGFNFLMVDYPGYGLSAGKPSDNAMFVMAKKVYDYAITREDVDPDHIVVMGYSLGTGVATYLSSQREVSGLILMAPYDEGLSLYNSKMNIFKGPLKLLATNHYDSKKYAEKVTVSPIILASKDDEMIPYSLSVELSKHFQNNPQLITYEGFYHNDFWGKDEVFTKIKAYLQEVAQ